MGGPRAAGAIAWTWRLPRPRHTRLADFRIGYLMEDRRAPVASDVASVYDRVLTELSRTGAVIKRGWPEGLDVEGQLKTYQFLLFAFMNAVGREEPAKPETHRLWMQETRRRLAFRAIWQKYFETHDVFLCPAGFSAAFPHDHSQPIEKRVIATPEGPRPYLDTPWWTVFATLSGLPATIAPVGLTATELPAGLQIVAPMWEDATSIEFAALLSDAIGGFSAPPAFEY